MQLVSVGKINFYSQFAALPVKQYYHLSKREMIDESSSDMKRLKSKKMLLFMHE
jgi:hypothetical protein